MLRNLKQHDDCDVGEAHSVVIADLKRDAGELEVFGPFASPPNIMDTLG